VKQQPIGFCNQAMDSKRLGIVARLVTLVVHMLGLEAIILVLVGCIYFIGVLVWKATNKSHRFNVSFLISFVFLFQF